MGLLPACIHAPHVDIPKIPKTTGPISEQVRSCHDSGGVLGTDGAGHTACLIGSQTPPLPNPIPTSVDELPSLQDACTMTGGTWSNADDQCM